MKENDKINNNVTKRFPIFILQEGIIKQVERGREDEKEEKKEGRVATTGQGYPAG